MLEEEKENKKEQEKEVARPVNQEQQQHRRSVQKRKIHDAFPPSTFCLVAGETSFYVPKQLLMSHSKLWKAALEQDPETSELSVPDDIDPNIIAVILSAFQTGSFKFSQRFVDNYKLL